jgi:hypothetical protein
MKKTGASTVLMLPTYVLQLPTGCAASTWAALPGGACDLLSC